jgi:PleD family two-component response regulator
VNSAADMQETLEVQTWDLIIADHNMPSFDSHKALALARRHDPNIPFIVVSGSIGEEVAVDAMKAGAHDYVMKNNLTRLLPAIERELREAQNRRSHKAAQATIRHMAYHDSLTGLVNRVEFERRLDTSPPRPRIRRASRVLRSWISRLRSACRIVLCACVVRRQPIMTAMATSISFFPPPAIPTFSWA